jgi:hypothetical protein
MMRLWRQRLARMLPQIESHASRGTFQPRRYKVNVIVRLPFRRFAVTRLGAFSSFRSGLYL